MTLEPIGLVRSCFGEKFGVPRQPGLCPSAWGHLVFHEAYRSLEAVRGLEGFSHLWLIFGFHETVGQGWHPTVRPPRLGGNRRVGVFASRSTYRPNGLGLSLVRLESIDFSISESPILRLGGLDLVDGTPVYDVKPYLPYAEALPEATAGFAQQENPRLAVEVTAAAEVDFQKLPLRARSVLREILSFDPRPATQSSDEGREYGVAICGSNVRFTVREGICRILEIYPAEASGLNS